MESKGYRLGNIDITVIAERPKLSPHKKKILDRLYELLKAAPETINLKVPLPLCWIKVKSPALHFFAAIV